MRNLFVDLRLRGKLILAFGVLLFLSLTAVGAFTYYLMRTVIEKNIESELTNSTTAIVSLIRASALASTKNYLRAVAESNLDLVEHFHREAVAGRSSDAEARRAAAAVLLSQKIGRTGYIYCVNSAGVVVVHPNREVLGQDVSSFEFVRDQIKGKLGYVEYQWKNPGETTSRPKALYMTYFEPWDWIISTTSYREEFDELVDIGDLREGIAAQRFGKTGYSYVVDRKGILLVHPEHMGKNVYELASDPSSFINEMVEKKRGKISYFWQNPGDRKERKKLVIYDTIPEFGWVVASSSYADELYSPLDFLGWIFAGAVVASLVIALLTTRRIASRITDPLSELRDNFERGARGDFAVRMEPKSGDEVGALTRYFNVFMEKLGAYHQELARSEAMFSTAFRSSPYALAIVRLSDGGVIDVNASFTALSGRAAGEAAGKTIRELGLFEEEEDIPGLPGAGVAGREVRIRAAGGEERVGEIFAEKIRVGEEACLLLTIVDITERRRLEKEILRVIDRERYLMAQDMHDDLLPHLIGIEALARVLAAKLAASGHEAAPSGELITALVDDAIEKARSVTRGLSSVTLSGRGIGVALADLATQTKLLFGVECECRVMDELPKLSPETTSNLYYIAKEAVHNAVKHAAATKIEIALRGVRNGVVLEVSDNGKGFEPGRPSGGMGMSIMALRANIVGARIEIESAPGKGSRVRLTPLPKKRRTEAR